MVTKSATLKIRGGCERDCYGKKAGKGSLIQWELSGTLGVSQDQTLFVWSTPMTQEEMGGCRMPNDHGKSPRQNNGLHSDFLSFAPSSHGGYAAGLGTLRASGGDIGGGSEVLVVEPICFRPEQTIKIDGGALRSRWNQGNTNPRNAWR